MAGTALETQLLRDPRNGSTLQPFTNLFNSASDPMPAFPRFESPPLEFMDALHIQLLGQFSFG